MVSLNNNFTSYLREEKKKAFKRTIRSALATMPKVRAEQRTPSGYTKHNEYHAIKYLKKQEADSLRSKGLQDEIYEMWSRVYDLIEKAESKPYFLCNVIADQLLQTDVPDITQCFQELTPILEVIVPIGTIKDDENFDVIAFVIVDCEIAYDMFDNPLRLTSTEDAPRYVICIFNEVGALMVMPAYSDGRDALPVTSETSTASNEVRERLKELRDICLNLLLLYEAHPEYVGLAPGPQVVNSSTGKSKKRNTLLPARIIGISTFQRTTADSSVQISTILTGRKMPPHIRRGHWRRTRFGSVGVTQYRWNWIKPVCVNL
jgi:hypothetical protein